MVGEDEALPVQLKLLDTSSHVSLQTLLNVLPVLFTAWTLDKERRFSPTGFVKTSGKVWCVSDPEVDSQHREPSKIDPTCACV